MATVNVTGAGTSTAAATGAISSVGPGKVYLLSNEVDLTSGAVTDADVYQCLAIPADTLVMQVKIEVTTAATGTTNTATVGDGDGAASWDASVNLKATAGTWTTSTVGTDTYAVAASMGKFYETADSIDLVMTATAITAGPKFEIHALCVDYNMA
jgi:hypothetical protein